MGKDAEKWRNRVEPHFGFVVDFGFGAVDVDDSSFWSMWVQYRSENSAIRISKSNEFNRCEVELIRLVNGLLLRSWTTWWRLGGRISWTR